MKRQTEQVANRRQAVADIMQKYKSAQNETVKGFAEKAGVSATTARGHFDNTQTNCPNVAHFLAYAEYLGPEFVNDVLALIGMGHARRTTRTIICPFGFHAESSRWAADQAVALADRVLDHQEKAYLAPIALERAEKNWQFHQFLTGAN
jgi:hypothetical protein